MESDFSQRNLWVFIVCLFRTRKVQPNFVWRPAFYYFACRLHKWFFLYGAGKEALVSDEWSGERRNSVVIQQRNEKNQLQIENKFGAQLQTCIFIIFLCETRVLSGNSLGVAPLLWLLEINSLIYVGTKHVYIKCDSGIRIQSNRHRCCVLNFGNVSII